MLLTFGQEAGDWGEVASIRVVAGDGTQSGAVYDGPVEGAAVSIGRAADGSSVQIDAEARNAAGELVATGKTPLFTAGELQGQTVPVLLVSRGHTSRPRDGLSGAWGATSASVLVGQRYALLASADGNGQAGEAYDVGLLLTSVGGPAWPRTPSLLLPAHTRDVMVISAEGASFSDVFVQNAATSTSLAAGDAAALLGGAVLESGDGSRWVVGPARDAEPSDRLLRLDEADTLQVAKLGTSRSGAAAVPLSEGSIAVLAGGVGSLELVAADGSVASKPLDERRAGGGAVLAEDGSLVIAGGTALDGTAAPTVRVGLPCEAICRVTPVSESLALSQVRAFPGKAGRAYLVGVADGETRVVHVAANALGVVFTPIPLRVPRRGAVVLAIPGERLVVLGGNDAAGPVREVEVVTEP